MKQFLVFVRKEFYHVFRDKKTLLLLFGIPLVQILMFGFALTNEIKNATLVVCDDAKDMASQRITELLEAGNTFYIERGISDPRHIEDAFKQGKANVAIIFPPHLYEELLHQNKAQIQIIADASDPNTANTLTSYATAIIMNYQKEVQTFEGTPMMIHSEVRMIYNPELKGAHNFVPGVMALVLFLVCVLMTSVSVVREKELGTMEILLVSPFHPLWVLVAKVVPYFFLSLVNVTLILFLSIGLLEMPMHGSFWLLYVASALLIVTGLSLGLMISNMTNSQQTAMLVSMMGMLLPTVMLSGFIFPLENMPLPLQWVAYVVPSQWYCTIVKSIMIKGLGIVAIWKELCVLAGMTFFFLTVSILKFKTRLE